MGMDLLVKADHAGLRLDRFLQLQNAWNFATVQKLLRKDKVAIEIEGRMIRKLCGSYRIQQNQIVKVFGNIKSNNDKVFTCSYSPINSSIILYENEGMLGVNKPAGLSVHSGPGVKDSLFCRLSKAYETPKLLNRLDKETSGVVLVAKNRTTANLILSLEMTKIYIAAVHGIVPEKEGIINDAIYRNFYDGFDSLSIKKKSKEFQEFPCRTLYERLWHNEKDNLSILKLNLLTGRTHQLRIHASQSLNAPIIGDTKYGRCKEGPMYLHSWKTIVHNFNGVDLCIEAPIPKHFTQLHPSISSLLGGGGENGNCSSQ